jgi:hypothetical protein
MYENRVVIILCTSKLISKYSWLFRGKISNLLTRPLHEFLCLTPAMILIFFLCNINIILLLHEMLQKLLLCSIFSDLTTR